MRVNELEICRKWGERACAGQLWFASSSVRFKNSIGCYSDVIIPWENGKARVGEWLRGTVGGNQGRFISHFLSHIWGMCDCGTKIN